MNQIPRTLLCTLLAAFVPAANGQIVLNDLSVFGRYDITSTGMLQADANWYASDTVDLTGDHSGNALYAVRRAQVYLRGKSRSARNVKWALGYDAAKGKWLDADFQYAFDDNRQTVWLGKFKQPVGMERLSAAMNNDFMSQSMLSDTFVVGRRLGISYRFQQRADLSDGGLENGDVGASNWSIQASYLAPKVTTHLIGDGGGFSLRGTWAPINVEGRILHFGLSYANYATEDDSLQLRARPNADLTPAWLVDTGDLLNTNQMATIGLESFWANGPFKLQGEYMTVGANRHEAGAGNFQGRSGYLSAVWNLTGQHWGYSGGLPVTLVSPRMWQLGLRFDAINLNDASVRGGWMKNVTVGANWYLNERWKFVLNHVRVRSKLGDTPDNPNITEARVQWVW